MFYIHKYFTYRQNETNKIVPNNVSQKLLLNLTISQIILV